MTRKKTDSKLPPITVIKRLPRYYRYLRELVLSDVKRISSASLARKMKVNPSQIRQDFNYFGEFGQQGYGYNVEQLYLQIGALLGVYEQYKAVIVGAGKLGSALAGSPVFSKRGVKVVGIFDSDKNIVGKEIAGLKVMDVEGFPVFCKSESVDIAVLTLPSDKVNEMKDALSCSGVKGIWNFTSVDLKNEDMDITVENVHMGDSLMTLCYNLQRNKTENDKQK